METRTFSQIYKASMKMLAAYRLRVLEGSDVENALDFARFVQMSGLTSLMTDNPEKDKRLAEWYPYDGHKLFAEADALRLLCGEYYGGKTNKADGTPRGVPRSALEGIATELQALRVEIEKVKPRKRIKPVPQLRVLKAPE